MKELVISRSNINIEALDANLKAQLGADYLAMSTGPGQVVVYLVNDASNETIELARQLVREHDETILTPQQQAEIDRQQALDDARNTYPHVISLGDFDLAALLVKQLAETVYLLGLEVQDLRKRIE